MDNQEFQTMNESTAEPVGYEEEDLISKLITPEKKDFLVDDHPLISRDIILSNLDEETIEVLNLMNDIREFIDFSNNDFKSWTYYEALLDRKMKLLTLMSRGKRGFQNKMLRTTINIQRGGIETNPDDLEI